MRNAILLSAAFLLISGASAAAQNCVPPNGGVSCLTKSCAQLGQTMMDGDGASIIACLNTSSTNTALIWKSMSVGTTGTELCVGVGPSAPNEMACTNSATGTVCYTDNTPEHVWNCNGYSGWNIGTGTVQCTAIGASAPAIITCSNMATGAVCYTTLSPEHVWTCSSYSSWTP